MKNVSKDTTRENCEKHNKECVPTEPTAGWTILRRAGDLGVVHWRNVRRMVVVLLLEPDVLHAALQLRDEFRLVAKVSDVGARSIRVAIDDVALQDGDRLSLDSACSEFT